MKAGLIVLGQASYLHRLYIHFFNLLDTKANQVDFFAGDVKVPLEVFQCEDLEALLILLSQCAALWNSFPSDLLFPLHNAYQKTYIIPFEIF